MNRTAANVRIFFLVLALSACGQTVSEGTKEISGSAPSGVGDAMEVGGMIAINITISGVVFPAEFHDTPSARALLEQMPFTIDMEDYAGQEKVATLPQSLPDAATERPPAMEAGELYLWSGNRLVLFYTAFPNAYGGYTRIGTITDPAGLASALDSETVSVTFSIP